MKRTSIDILRADSSELLRRLEVFGDPHPHLDWVDGDPDLVAEFGVTADDVPALIAIARSWVERTDWPDDDRDVSIYAPIHAWRTLGQLGADAAVEPLIAMIDPMDRRHDDWHLNEFPDVFALLGAASIEPLTAFLNGEDHGEYARMSIADSLARVAQRDPETRDDVVRALANQLERFADESETLNAGIVGSLLDLEASEAAEVIERAFAAGRVELGICGNWNDVRAELGVEGQGLVPAELAGERRLPEMGFPPRRTEALATPSTRSQQPKAKSRRRNARKRERQNRRRGRRRRG